MPSTELSAAVPMYVFKKPDGTDGTLVPVDMHPFVPLFDRLYLMAYDLWNGDDTAGSNAALVRNGDVPQDQRFGDDGVKTWHDAGFPMSKLVYGTP